jgi:hypothetical protein
MTDDAAIYYRHILPSQKRKNRDTDKWMQSASLMLTGMHNQQAQCEKYITVWLVFREFAGKGRQDYC